MPAYRLPPIAATRPRRCPRCYSGWKSAPVAASAEGVVSTRRVPGQGDPQAQNKGESYDDDARWKER